MKTIEERAQEYAYISKERGDLPYELAEQVYIEVATEQYKIDIGKAVSALFNCHCLPWDNIDAGELERDFRKEMEEFEANFRKTMEL